MNILIIGNTASTGWHLRNKLKERGHIAHLRFKETPTLSGKSDKEFFPVEEYDIVHFNAPQISAVRFIKEYTMWKKAKRVVCHWHGTDLRCLDYKVYKKNRKSLKFLSPLLYTIYKTSRYLTKRTFFKGADYNFYSTHDLAWWLRGIPNNKKEHIYCPIDTDTFKPIKCEKQGTFINIGGGLAEGKEKIKHDDMSKHLNKFEKAEIYPAYGISPYILSVTAMECLACGLKVKHHPEKDRNWIIKNCSTPVFTDKVLEVYERLIKE